MKTITVKLNLRNIAKALLKIALWYAILSVALVVLPVVVDLVLIVIVPWALLKGLMALLRLDKTIKITIRNPFR